MTSQRRQTGSDVLLAINEFSAFHGPIPAVRGVTLGVVPGEAVGVLGPNGAGKSTLLMGIAGFLRSSGGVVLDGKEVRGAPPDKLRRGGLVLVPQDQATIPQLTLLENLRLAWLTGRRGRSLQESLDHAVDIFPALRGRFAEPAGNLSGGQRQMLAVARGYMGDPRVLMLDEPTAGLSPKLISDLTASIRALQQQGVTILLVEQNVGVVEAICQRVNVLVGGTSRWIGQMSELARDDLSDLYSGKTRQHGEFE